MLLNMNYTKGHMQLWIGKDIIGTAQFTVSDH
jgi:hypothetical protein